VTFWNTVIRFERSKVTPWIGLRNALGVALPLIVGAAIGQTAGGLMTAIGALNVSYSDGVEPYRQRARRMLAASCFGALAVGAGGLLSRDHLLPVPLAAMCAFAAGMMAAVGETPSNIGVMTLATLIVFAAQALTPVAALQSGLLAFGGGLLQTALAVASWPMRRYGPERRALAALYSELAHSAGNAQESAAPNAAPSASQQSTDAQGALTSLAGDHSIDAERYLALLSQAERIRLALLALARLRIRMGRERGSGAQTTALDRSLKAASPALTAIAESIKSDAGVTPLDQVRQIEAAANQLRGSADAMTLDARWQLDALAGQIRSASELAFHTTPVGSAVFAARESAIPWMLRLAGAMANLRANLSLDSAIFRHALRMAACVAIAEAISRYTGSRRGYWLPMTVAIVLRPDFTGTFTRGVLRVGGTLAGLLVATGLVHFLMPAGAWPEIFLIVFFTFLLRCFGSANYGIFVMALTALIVFLVSLTGLAPGPIMIARGLNTMAGGAIALVAYWLWPTWERTLTPDLLADMLDAYRQYLQAVRDAYLAPGGEFAARLDRTRLAARLARSNAEASLARLRTEPGVSEDQVTRLTTTLVTTHRLVHALMSLEAGLATSAPVPPRDAFRKLANDADATLYYLGAALRGSAIARGHLPDLREDHHALLQTGDPHVGRYALVNVETDRMVNSLNTLSEHVLDYTERFVTPVTR
jgi:uncharacterized membrane protein YccC